MKRLKIVGCWLLMTIFVSVQANAQRKPRKPAAVPMATYRSPAGDVSFDYPVVWKLDNSANFYLAPHILQNETKPIAQVIFSPVGNLYEKTTLTDLVFVYAKVPQLSDVACTALAVGSVPAKADTIVINGLSFQHFDTGDAGMCHGVDQHIYWTRQNGSCYLFEADMHTTCSGAYDGQRDLTKTETKALMRHLLDIPPTIRISVAK